MKDTATAFFEPERLLSAEHPPRSPLVNRLLNPFIAAPVFLGAYALALFIGQGINAVEYNTIPDFLGGHLYVSKAIFFAMAFAVVFAARRWPTLRDPLNLAVGLVYTGLVLRWLGLPLLAWVFVIYYLMPKLNSHLSLLLTAVAAVLFVRYLPPVKIPGYGYYYALMSLRLIYYAFERSGIRKKHLSITAAVGYVFGILWWNGPDLLAYSTLHTPKPREVTDRQSARMFYWTALKFLSLAVLMRLIYLVLPDPLKFDTLAEPAKLFAFAHPWLAIYWLRTFVGQEIGIGLANMAGYYMHDLMIYPLLAPTPLHMFRRHNLTTLNFYRRVVIYEVARRFKNSMVMAIFFGMTMAFLHHSFIGFCMNRTVTLRNGFLGEIGIPIIGLINLYVALYMAKVYDRVRPLAKFVFVPTMWLLACLQNFDFTGFWYGYKGLNVKAFIDRYDCFIGSVFSNLSCADATFHVPWYFRFLSFGAILLVVALLVDGIGKLVPALRSQAPMPHPQRPPSDSKAA